ncbi:MAG: hypothetical protein ACM3S1_13475 [Hyphomicrobiales bacterium]
MSVVFGVFVVNLLSVFLALAVLAFAFVMVRSSAASRSTSSAA